MKRLEILFLIVLMGFTAAHAQITITHTSIAGPGTSYTEGVKDSATFNVGSSGPGQTWTFGSYNWDEVGLAEFVEPSSTPYASSFPTATRATRAPMPDMPDMIEYEYERIQTDQWLYLGIAWDEGQFDTVMVLDPPMLMAPLPLSYGRNWTTVRRDTTEFMGFVYVTTDSSIVTVDGWGTINTPYGSYQVLRGFSHSWYSTILNGRLISSHEDYSYTWLNQQGLVVVSVQSEWDESNPNFTNGFLQMLGAPLTAEPLRGPVATAFAVGQNYPNPFNPTTSLPVELSKSSRISLTIYDELGREVSSQTFQLPAGAHTLPVEASQWSTGTYFARIAVNDAVKTVKMNLVK